MSHSVELARQEGVEFRLVRLMASPVGVSVKTTDIGPTAQQVWGRDGEYEFWVEVPAEALVDLVFALLQEKYAGKLEAATQFQEFCESNDISHELASWT